MDKFSYVQFFSGELTQALLGIAGDHVAVYGDAHFVQLDFGRVTFGATCTGHAKVCLEAMCKHAKNRRQFQQTLAEFELVKKKVAWAAAHASIAITWVVLATIFFNLMAAAMPMDT